MTTYKQAESTIGKLEIDFDNYAENPYESYDHGIKIYSFSNRYNLGEDGGYSESSTILSNICYDLGIDYNDDTTEEQMINRIQKKAIFEPIYIYEHSSVALSTTPFNDRWDSGQVGWYLVDKNSLEKNFGYKKRTKKAIEQVEKRVSGLLDNMQAHINGDVYMWFIYDSEGEILESCTEYYDIEHIYNEFETYINYNIPDENKNQFLKLVEEIKNS